MSVIIGIVQYLLVVEASLCLLLEFYMPICILVHLMSFRLLSVSLKDFLAFFLKKSFFFMNASKNYKKFIGDILQFYFLSKLTEILVLRNKLHRYEDQPIINLPR